MKCLTGYSWYADRREDLIHAHRGLFSRTWRDSCIATKNWKSPGGIRLPEVVNDEVRTPIEVMLDQRRGVCREVIMIIKEMFRQ